MSKTKTKKKIQLNKSSKKIIAIIALAVFIITVVVGLIATAFSAGSRINYRFDDKDIAKGIDVSSHNGRINWDAVSDKVDFAFVRVGYSGYSNGKLVQDTHMKRNLRRANANGVPVGVYFYSQAISVEEAVAEAEFTLKLVRHYDISLPIVIDFEYAYLKNGEIGGRLYNANLSRKQASEIINAFCKTVRKAGYKSACYASTYFYNMKIDTKKLDDSICIWVADYNKELTYKGKFDIWQYSNTGQCDGVKSKNVDLDYWYIKK